MVLQPGACCLGLVIWSNVDYSNLTIICVFLFLACHLSHKLGDQSIPISGQLQLSADFRAPFKLSCRLCILSRDKSDWKTRLSRKWQRILRHQRRNFRRVRTTSAWRRFVDVTQIAVRKRSDWSGNLRRLWTQWTRHGPGTKQDWFLTKKKFL